MDWDWLDAFPLLLSVPYIPLPCEFGLSHPYIALIDLRKMPKAVTVFDRENQFCSEGFYVFDKQKKILMCKYCNCRIEWARKDTCAKHCEGAGHKKFKEEAKENGQSVKRQASPQETCQSSKMARIEKNHFVMATSKAFLEANIPIEKLDNLSLRSWMSEYIPGAGDLPSADMMRKTYIPQVREDEEAFLRQKVKDQQISILCDETTDRKGQCVFLVLIKILECSDSSKLYVGGAKILTNANATECGRAIMDVVNKLEISFTNVSCIVTDSAAYMKKCVDSLKVLFGESLVHIQCWAHKLNLVSNIFQINLKELNECILQVKSAFLNTRKRKHAYLAFLQQRYSEGEKKAKLFPSPVATRWNSWHKAAIYVNEYLSDIREFFSLVGEGGSAVHRLSSLTEEEVAIIQCQAAFVVEHCEPIAKLLVCLEGAYPYSYKLQSQLIDLGNSLKIVSDGCFGNDTSSLIKNLPKKLAPVLTAALTNAATKAKIKLSQLEHGDTAKGFLHSIGQLFDERFMRSTTNNDIIRASKHLPLMAALSSQTVLEGHAAVKSALTKALSNGYEFNLMSELLNLKKDHAEFVHASVKSLMVDFQRIQIL